MAAQHRIGMPEKWDRLDTHTVTADDFDAGTKSN